ncbi:MAG: cytochrome c biogenesis protein CcsA [Planctomycetes bacterium]|nr:cytochrome c biogenesis protein CcsA [Planctomycetota bacterium]
MRRILLLVLLAAGLAAADPAALERLARSVEVLPALHDGRVKPLASVARHGLLALSGRSSIPLAGGRTLSAGAWLVEGLADPAGYAARPAVRLRFAEVAHALGLEERPGLRYGMAEVGAGLEAHRDQLAPLFAPGHPALAPAEAQLVELDRNLAQVQALVGGRTLALVPGPAAAREAWLPLAAVADPDPVQAEVMARWRHLLAALAQGDAAGTEREAAGLAGVLAPFAPPARLRAEVAYHHLAPFDLSLGLDLLCLVLLAAGLLLGRPWLRRAAVASLAAGTCCHLLGLTARMWIMQRPPVATLYESVLFVAAVAALLGLVVERQRRGGEGVLVGAVLAAGLLCIGRGYADDGDTMGMLGAVLNSNFWLTVHVLTITIGYGCTLMAGVAGHVALAVRALHPGADGTHRQHDRMLLVLALLALLFTLLGTILGGIWADQSWGRFWGWDPKKNGALLIVLWLLLLLHLRVGGCAGPLGFAAGLVLGNIVVALAWFGVNLLGIGLHSYGFASGTLWALVWLAAVEVLLAGGLWLWATLRRPRPAG